MHSFTELVTLFEEKFTANFPFPDLPARLYDPCRYLLGLGGKRIRPVLCLMGNELFGEINEDAWHAADAIELFHNFTLVHDDIMDKAPLRRGNPTVHEKYGLTTGILSGDVMNIYAYHQLANVEAALPKVLQLFNKTAIEVCEGQQMDMDFETRDDVHIDEYIHMITLKTSVLLACSLKMGALIGGSLGDNANKLYAFGKNLGIAFQLQDDYLDAFGHTDKLGKQNGGDIIANKKTWLLIKALEKAQGKRKAELTQWIAAPRFNKKEKIKAVKAIYDTLGIPVLAGKKVDLYFNKGFSDLQGLDVHTHTKGILKNYTEGLIQRQS